jgi:hypothetical protein
MSWKGDSLDYTEYPGGSTSPSLTGRQQSTYQPEQSSNNSVSAHSYDGNEYPSKFSFSTTYQDVDHAAKSVSDSTVNNSQSQVTYPTSEPSIQSISPQVPSFRSSSVAFPPGLELRNQYRPLPSQQSGAHGPPPTPRGTSFASAFSSGGFQSAPLIAPADFQLPRTPVDTGPREYHMTQMSAPMAPPQDFTNAYNQNLSPARPTQQPEPALHSQRQQQQQAPEQSTLQEQQTETAGFLREDNYEAVHKRKRTYSMPGAFQSH